MASERYLEKLLDDTGNGTMRRKYTISLLNSLSMKQKIESPTPPSLDLSAVTDAITGKMTLSSIRYFILGDDMQERQLLQKIDSFLHKELSATEIKTEKYLATLFSAIVTKMRLFPVETPEMRQLFRRFIEELRDQISTITHGDFSIATSENIHPKNIFGYLKRLIDSVEFRLKILENKVRLNQMRAFLHLAEYYVHYLESMYKNLSMSERVLELYVIRMDIKKSHLFFEKRFGAWFGMAFFRGISAYGTSFGRLAVTCIVSVMLFGSIYWLADFFAPENLRMIHDLSDYSSYFFNSLVTISGLGIDASPQTALQRVAMGVNTIYGMVIFGMLFNVISTKLSMNS